MGYRGEIKFKFKPTLTYFEIGNNSENYDYVGYLGSSKEEVCLPALYEVGDRIGQIIILPYPKVKFIEVNELSSTDRGEEGFGHTGK